MSRLLFPSLSVPGQHCVECCSRLRLPVQILDYRCNLEWAQSAIAAKALSHMAQCLCHIPTLTGLYGISTRPVYDPVRRTHTSDNYTQGVPTPECGFNHGEPTPLTLAYDVVVWVCSLRPGECTTTPSPLGGYDEMRECRPQNDTGLLLRSHSQHLVASRRTTTTTDDEPTNEQEPTGARNETTTSRQGPKRRPAPADQLQLGLPTLNGWAQTRAREAEDLGWRSPSPPCRVRGAAAPSIPEDIPLEGPETEGGEREA